MLSLSSRRIRCTENSDRRRVQSTSTTIMVKRRRKSKNTYHKFIMNEYTTIRNDGDQEDDKDKEKDQRSI